MEENGNTWSGYNEYMECIRIPVHAFTAKKEKEAEIITSSAIHGEFWESPNIANICP